MTIITFWLVLAIIFHVWIGYPVLLSILSSAFPRRLRSGALDSHVTVLLTVHNEERTIEEKLENLLKTEYPADRFDILVASDGSTDRTDEIVQDMALKDGRIRLFGTEGGGKSATQNKAMQHARGEIVVLTDAEASFAGDTIGKMVVRFSDARVGCVSGKMILRSGGNAIAESQGFYWTYEMLLRRSESLLGVLHTASGQIMAFRKRLFRPFDCKYGDDCIIPLDVLSQGYLVVHADDAIAYDTFPSSMKGEFRARVRMTLRNITCTLSRYALLNPFRHPLLSFSILSHKVLRWLTPYFLGILLATNIWLAVEGQSLYRITLLAQGIFYGAGLVGGLAERAGLRVPGASHIFSFLLANAGFGLGVYKALRGEGVRSYRNAR